MLTVAPRLSANCVGLGAGVNLLLAADWALESRGLAPESFPLALFPVEEGVVGAGAGGGGGWVTVPAAAKASGTKNVD